MKRTLEKEGGVRTRRSWARFGKTLVALLLFSLLLIFVDWRLGLALMADANGMLLVAALGLFPLGILLSSLKWELLLRSRDLCVPRFQLFRYYWIGFFANNFLPSSIGGDVARMALFRKSGRLVDLAASILVERITGVAVLLAWVVLSISLQPGYVGGGSLATVIWLAVAAIPVILVLFCWGGHAFLPRLEKLAGERRSFIAKSVGKVNEVFDALMLYRGATRVLLLSLLLSLVFYLTPLLLHFFLFQALGSGITLTDVFFIVPLVTLVGLIPVSLNSLGLTEAAFVVLYGYAGALPEEALAAAILARLLAVLASLVGGGFWLLEREK